MQVRFDDRAEVAFHSLSLREQARVEAMLGRVATFEGQQLLQMPFIYALRQKSGKPLWVLRVSQRLRLIASFEDGTFKVEDIVPQDRLDRVAGRRRS